MFVDHISHRVIEGWGTVLLTLSHAIAFCSQHSIRIVEDENQPDGELAYYSKNGRPYTFILISPFLDPGMKLWVLWHEIAHFILHYPSAAKFSNACTEKCDKEANYVAAIAMMPRLSIEGRTINEVIHEFKYPRPLVELRYQIYKNDELNQFPTCSCSDTPDNYALSEILKDYPHLIRRGKDWPKAEIKRRAITSGEKAARIAVLMKQFEKPEEPLPF